MKKSLRIYLSGAVQDVLFRDFIKKNAEEYNVRGFARNLEDGRLEVFLEGDTDDVAKMIEICKTGPKSAEIKNTEIIEEKFQDFKTFKILHI